MEHDSRSVANELIRRAHEASRDITVMQVMKLVYYCHVWMLAIHHRPLLNEAIEAWHYGPAIPRICHCPAQPQRKPATQPDRPVRPGHIPHPAL